MSTVYPMKDDPGWSDHKIIWHDTGEETIEWCEHLELIALGEDGEI